MSRIVRARGSFSDRPANSSPLPARRTWSAAISITRAPLASTSLTRSKSMMMWSASWIRCSIASSASSAVPKNSAPSSSTTTMRLPCLPSRSVSTAGRTLRERRTSACTIWRTGPLVLLRMNIRMATSMPMPMPAGSETKITTPATSAITA